MQLVMCMIHKYFYTVSYKALQIAYCYTIHKLLIDFILWRERKKLFISLIQCLFIQNFVAWMVPEQLR